MAVDLRAERERRGLSIEQVSVQSRIPQQYLEALETGQHDTVPRGPFLDSYQRQYLAFLGLSVQAPVVVRRPVPVAPPAGAETTEATAVVTRDVLGADMLDEGSVDPDERTLGRTVTRQYDSVPVVRLVLAGFLVTMALVLTLKLLSGVLDRSLAPAPATAALTREAAAPAAKLPAPPPEPQPVEEPPKAAPEEPALDDAGPPAALPDMRVHLRAHERVRVTVELDDNTVFSGWLEPGESHDFHGQDRIAVDVGDLTRLAIHYDGERVDPLGNLSHPRRLVFLRDGE